MDEKVRGQARMLLATIRDQFDNRLFLDPDYDEELAGLIGEALSAAREEGAEQERQAIRNFKCIHHDTPMAIICPTCVAYRAREEGRREGLASARQLLTDLIQDHDEGEPAEYHRHEEFCECFGVGTLRDLHKTMTALAAAPASREGDDAE